MCTCSHRHSIHCIVPPYMTDQLVQSSNPEVRARALATVKISSALRAERQFSQAFPSLRAHSFAAEQGKDRVIYDARQTDRLKNVIVRREGQEAGNDVAVNEAYDYSGDTYDFYESIFQRNSLDDRGMTLISAVHVAEPDYRGGFVPMNNAFWNGELMAYGDGDGIIFNRFTQSLDVVGHELTHGVQSFTSNLTYYGQPGALNEHFSDVFGILIRQWKKQEEAKTANWTIGSEVLVPAATRHGIRDMLNPGKAYVDDPDLGTDPQPGHMNDLYTGPYDNNGVHINSGIPNRVFALVATELGGNAWDVAGRIWYDTMLQLTSSGQFKDCAKLTVQIAGSQFGEAEKKVVSNAWKTVGLTI
ncbi:peptidase M4 family protein [Siphonobacter sp. BAB-5405]|uniref:M4 family metallopeptidase n=1 Tax=Siphonobacter sp. BAB-5405 TaxID=1864825 RepID=UPI000C805D4F|nr:M4 family metallopeptidase [Siphonobacter sp. BAB-5405]PMD96576.1 peptidase M4 family protein [Siphonobacter sp. BAB-5405]